jgi:serine O-acetyltransferase
MIPYSMNTKSELRAVLNAEKDVYLPPKKRSLMYKLRNPFKSKTYQYLTHLRKYEYHCSKRDNAKNPIVSKFHSLRIKGIDIRMKRLGLRLGLEMIPHNIGKGIKICHPNVIINGAVGENCIFHGNNVIGNKKTGKKDAIPKIGSNVDIGIGAMVIGDVEIADHCIIGAGAVVTKSFTTPGSVIAGVPAKLIQM